MTIDEYVKKYDGKGIDYLKLYEGLGKGLCPFWKPAVSECIWA